MAKKNVFFFGDGSAEGKGNDKNLLGGKGANLAEMVNIGLPVPAGFTISKFNDPCRSLLNITPSCNPTFAESVYM